jgi:SAM-dependent methyltransferase
VVPKVRPAPWRSASRVPLPIMLVGSRGPIGARCSTGPPTIEDKPLYARRTPIAPVSIPHGHGAGLLPGSGSPRRLATLGLSSLAPRVGAHVGQIDSRVSRRPRLDLEPRARRRRPSNRSKGSRVGGQSNPPDLQACNPHLPSRLDVSLTQPSPQYTHRLFRFPAKFHPPVVRKLLDLYTEPGQTVLDPFCGSGTMLVEAAVSGRQGIGVDIDPLSVFVTRVKTLIHDSDVLHLEADKVLTNIMRHRRSAHAYEAFQFSDLSDVEFEREISGLFNAIPQIPNLEHWFRRYVIADLALIYTEIEQADVTDSTRSLMKLVFASIIRNASNADPVPVSGLEVTKHMRERDRRGRVVDPFIMYSNALKKALVAATEFSLAARSGGGVVFSGDATDLPAKLPLAHAIITSPPYNSAVDYYRRHTLEMYWLGFVSSQQDRLLLLPKYIGRHKIAMRDPRFQLPWEPGPLAEKWESNMREHSSDRASVFRHYVLSMTLAFEQMARKLYPGGLAIMVVGRSLWKNQEIPTDELMRELAQPGFILRESAWYPVVNRYMSYSRKNNANISEEFALVLEKI